LARRIDEACNRFEVAWRTGGTPQVLDFLVGWEGAERAALLRELVLLEMHYRQGRGEDCHPEEYLQRFPELHPASLAPEGVETTAPQSRGPEVGRTDPHFAQEKRTDEGPLAGSGQGTFGDYELHAEIARGGMGVVYRARQVSLNRVVALKMLLHADRASAAERARFWKEPEAVARLSHPNIVQVYEVGEHEGRLYFSMEYCAGGSLDQKLGGTPLAPRPAAQLTETLARAVQAAHDCCVIHRDLKPANVLLAGPAAAPASAATAAEAGAVDPSAWGTPKVSDFGLARKLDESGQTASGALLGTPSYMAPEQARGQARTAGPAADVYALGAILYESLTGRPPFKGASWHDTLAQVCQDDPVPVRRLQPKVPRDLETICLKCLRKEPRCRYASAVELAEDLGRFLAGKPIHARPVGRVERAWKWARRNPALAGLLAAVLAGTVVSTLFAVQARRQAAAESQARRQTRAALDAMSSHVVEDWLSRRGQLDPAQREFLEKALSYYEGFAAEAGNSEEARRGAADAHLRIGKMRYRLGQHREAEAAYQRALERYANLAAEFPAMHDYPQQLAQSHYNLGILQYETGRPKEAETAFGQALAIQQQLAAEFPAVPQYRQELAGTHAKLGNVASETGRPNEAETHFRHALAIQEGLAAEFPAVPLYRQELAASHHNLGYLLQDMGRPKEAEPFERSSLAIRAQLAAEFPAVAIYRRELAASHNNLAILLRATGRMKEAEAAFAEGLVLYKRLAAEFPAVPLYRWEQAGSHNNVAVVLMETGRVKEAEGALHDALALYKGLAADFPTVPLYRQELARSHYNLGNLSKDTGRGKDAEAPYREALALFKPLVAEVPAMPEYRQELARTHGSLGLVLTETGRLKEAEVALHDALAIFKSLITDFSDRPDYKAELANTLEALASVSRRHKNYASARQLLEQARPYLQAALDSNPDNPYFRTVFCENRRLLAVTLLDLTDHASAAEAAVELARMAFDPTGDAYNAACVFSRCIPVAEQDAKLPAARRKELARSYGERAVEALRQAVAKGYKDATHMKKDKDLDSLRQRDDFRKLLAELEAKQDKGR
jgi:tetratricopeptide (TPR) repeat protein